ncbi:hypothetical protein DL95DRAFT_398778 [Leptodontidium sp. 2 PMI_412]|nr:hypothetical protein DL95DRAFT_398778 [Leptodontidium sp. 2 PMI_412]
MMTFRLIKTEPYPSELPPTPPTPYPSPTLRHASLHTLLPHRLSEDGDPELRPLTFSHRPAFSLPKNITGTGKYVTRSSNTQKQPHLPSIDPRTQNDTPPHKGDQQRGALAMCLNRQRPAPNDVSAWWRDTNVIGCTIQVASPTSTLLDFGQIKASRATLGQSVVR